MKNKNIFQSIRCAAHGIAECYKNERNFMEYTAIALFMLILNILLRCAVWEYIVFFALVTATFSAEFLNTAIERVIDTYDNTISEKNRFINRTEKALRHRKRCLFLYEKAPFSDFTKNPAPYRVKGTIIKISK